MSDITLPEHLWSVPAYLQPPLTDAIIADAEVRLGVRLPRAYLAALRIQNGGYLRARSHPAVPAPVDHVAGIGPRFPSILRHNWSEIKEYMAEERITTPERIDDLLPCAQFLRNSYRVLAAS